MATGVGTTAGETGPTPESTTQHHSLQASPRLTFISNQRASGFSPCTVFPNHTASVTSGQPQFWTMALYGGWTTCMQPGLCLGLCQVISCGGGGPIPSLNSEESNEAIKYIYPQAATGD